MQKIETETSAALTTSSRSPGKSGAKGCRSGLTEPTTAVLRSRRRNRIAWKCMVELGISSGTTARAETSFSRGVKDRARRQGEASRSHPLSDREFKMHRGRHGTIASVRLVQKSLKAGLLMRTERPEFQTDVNSEDSPPRLRRATFQA